MDEKDRLEILKEIFLTEDRAYAEKISVRIAQLEELINERKQLSEKVDPIIQDQLKTFSRKIPSTLGPAITAALKSQIKEHKDEVVDVLYPIMGRMIKKYVAQEMKMLTEKINSQLGFQGWKRRMRSLFGGVKEEELLLSELSTAKIEQVFLIERGSGILTATYGNTQTVDEEMVSGMLTAIKSFVEDAFGQKNQNLELIEYELYNIHLQSFVEYYVAVVISGNYTLKSKDVVQDIIFDFYSDFRAMKKVSEVNKDVIEKELELNFGDAVI